MTIPDSASPSPALPPGSLPDGRQQVDAVMRLLARPVSVADLEAGAEYAARPVKVGSANPSRLLVFRIDDEHFAVPSLILRRVTPVARPSPIPHRSSGILRGVCNIRGELVLCADLRAMLGFPARGAESAPSTTASDPRRMVVIGPPENSWAFEVDALIGVEEVDIATLGTPPVTVKYAIGAFTTGVTEINGHGLTVLDGERVLAGLKAGLA